MKTYETLGQGPLLVTPVHSGLECGFFVDACPDLDCVSMGPDTFDLHSPQESLSISSTFRVSISCGSSSRNWQSKKNIEIGAIMKQHDRSFLVWGLCK